MQGTEPTAQSGIQRTQAAEKKLVANIDLAATVAEELSKFGNTDFRIIEALSVEFLRNAQEAKQILSDIIAEQELSTGGAYQGRPYIARLKAEAAEAGLKEADQTLARLREQQQQQLSQAAATSGLPQATVTTI